MWWKKSIALFSALLLVLALSGCDGDSGTATVHVQGRVTDNQGYGSVQGASKQAAPTPQAAVEGAVVTAARVQGNGSLQPLDGQVQTDASGNFTLEVAAQTGDVLMLRAEKDNFRSAVLVTVNVAGGGTVRAMPMTAESKAEAEVYVAVREQDDNAREDAEDATPAQVSVYVTADLAAQLQAGGITTAQVAAALQQAARAEAAFVNRTGASLEALAQARQRQQAAWLNLQQALYAAGSAQAEAEAMTAFEQAFVEAYAEAGISAEARAKLLQTARLAVTHLAASGNATARFALRKQAEILSALATSAAIEAAFEAEGATQARMDSLRQARMQWLASLRAAASTSAIEQARAQYSSVVEAALAASLGISTEALANVKASLQTAVNALQMALSIAGSATAVAEASVAFYSSAEGTINSSLQGNARAGLAATVLALLSVN